ncbi:MAG TPA: hypothetical protein VL754_12340 [Verrucomicrobiae bacterium]|jgi:hypothetical protein|nr:hypothetical protein [Verrucomicrobiae bacterium]
MKHVSRVKERKRLENEKDLTIARAALAEAKGKRTVPWSKLKKEAALSKNLRGKRKRVS